MQRPNSETVTLSDILITEELSRRVFRAPDLLAENQAMRRLIHQMAQDSAALLQSLVDTALELCQAGTTGVSLLETTADGAEIFRWNALAGTLVHHVGGSTPRNFSPCGVCLDQGAPVLFSHPERYFTYFQETNTPIVEGLVLPLIADRHIFGTIWIMSHDQQRQFDSEDVRVMTSLADLTATCLLQHRQTRERLAANAVLETEIVEHKQTEATLHASEADLAADLAGMERLYELYARLASETDLKAALDEILAAACEFTHTDRGCIQLVSDDGERLEMFAWRGYSDDSPFINYFRYEGFKQGCDAARAKRRRFLIEDTISYPGLVGTEAGAVADAEGVRATQSTPMISHTGEALGVLSTQFRQPHRPSDDELKRIDLLVWTAANFVERHRATTALRQSEENYRSLFTVSDEKYRSLFNSIYAGFCVIEVLFDESGNAFDYRFLEANPAFEQQTGLVDAIGKTMRKLAPQHEAHWFEIYGRIAQTGIPERFENAAQELKRFYDVYAFRIGEPQEHKIAVLFNDISDRKQAEQELTKTNRLLQATFDNSLQDIQLFKAVRDERGDIIDFEWLLTNKQWNDQWGEMAGKRLLTENPAVIETGLFEMFKQVTESGVPITHEHYYPHEQFDGWFWQTIAQVEDGFLLSTIDISERKRAEIALSQSEAKYRSLFNSIDEGYLLCEVIFDETEQPMDILYLEANPAAIRLAGRDFSGRRMREIDPNYEDYWYELIGRVALTGESVRAEHYAQPHGRWFDFYASRVGGPESRRVASIFQDTTERKERERQQEFLLKLSDALRAETNADDVANRAVGMLLEQMGLDRCYIGVYRLEEDRADLAHQVGNERVPPLPERIRLSDFPEAFRVTFDRTLVIEDIAETEGLSDTDRRNIAALGFRALIAATLRKGENKPLWAIVAVAASPRRWTRGEIALVEEVAERTWAAVERARAEAAVEEDLRDTQMLHNLATRLSIEEDMQALYQEIVKTAIALTQADAGSFQILDHTTQELVLIATQGIDRTMAEHFHRLDASSNTSCGIALTTGERTFLNFDVPESEDPDGSLRMHKDAGLRCVQSTPLRSRSGEPIGMISTHWREDHQLSDRELRFLDLLARQAADIIEQRQAEEDRIQLIHEQSARKQEHQRAVREAARSADLAELDRTKTLFFSNISHEFRTPLTLLLAPLQDALRSLEKDEGDKGVGEDRGVGEVPSSLSSLPSLSSSPSPPSSSSLKELLQLAYRNSLRLLKLVNTLLDFSRIEAGRIEAVYEPTDLATFTTELSSVFRSAIERAGLQLIVDCPPLPEPVFVDREMWEKIVLNLLSNAFKFTFEGEITVSLRAESRIERQTSTSNVDNLTSEHQAPSSEVNISTSALQVSSSELEISASKLETSASELNTSTPELETSTSELGTLTSELETSSPETMALGFDLSTDTSQLRSQSSVLLAKRGAALTQHSQLVILQIRDTGTGIAPEHLPHLFERFYQVRGVQARTHEGSGIGLALVHELVRLHGGEIAVSSTLGEGTCFTITLPFGTDHIPPERIQSTRTLTSTAVSAGSYVEEVERWLPTDSDEVSVMRDELENNSTQNSEFLLRQPQTEFSVLNPQFNSEPSIQHSEFNTQNFRVLIVDDNADMRQYLTRILSEHVHVEAVADGTAALAAMQAQLPDLVLSDVMMPRLDGFGLLQTLRSDPRTREIPVILLSARAGEEAIAEGLAAGADDYLIKPFSAQELVSRVNAHLQLSHLRGEALHEARTAIRRKDELLSVVSHELNTPLVSILGWTRLLRANPPNSAMLGTALDAIERSATMQAKLVQDLLDVSRITAGKLRLYLQPTELEAVIEGAIATVTQLAAEAEIHLIWTETASAVVMSDRERLQQVVCNLLTNAIKFTPEGGRVEVCLSLVTRQQSLVSGQQSLVEEQITNEQSLMTNDQKLMTNDNYAEIRVTDTGIGIAPDFLPHVFEQFRQAGGTNSAKGLGLGLAIAHHIVELHRGTIQAQSAGKGQGATFIIRLPLLQSNH